jgi:hypothetical protein
MHLDEMVLTSKSLENNGVASYSIDSSPDGGIGRHTGLKICLEALSVILAETPT